MLNAPARGRRAGLRQAIAAGERLVGVPATLAAAECFLAVNDANVVVDPVPPLVLGFPFTFGCYRQAHGKFIAWLRRPSPSAQVLPVGVNIEPFEQ